MLISTNHVGQSLFRLLPRTPTTPNLGFLEWCSAMQTWWELAPGQCLVFCIYVGFSRTPRFMKGFLEPMVIRNVLNNELISRESISTPTFDPSKLKLRSSATALTRNLTTHSLLRSCQKQSAKPTVQLHLENCIGHSSVSRLTQRFSHAEVSAVSSLHGAYILGAHRLFVSPTP